MSVLLLVVVVHLGVCQSTFWKISGNGLSKPSYLFGTIHLPSKRIYALNDSLLPAIEKVDAVALELDMEEMSNPMTLLPYMMLKGDKTLKGFFTEEEYIQLKESFEKQTGQSIALFQKFKPFVLMSMVAQSYFNEEDNAPMTLDEFLNYYAVSKDVKVLGLETIQEQMNIMDKMPAKVLLESLTDTDSIEVLSESLIQSYLKGEIDEVAKMMEEDNTAEAWMNELLVDRNDVMFERSKKRLTSGESLFIAVGCGHLAGKNGLIAQYRSSGYTVEPMISTSTELTQEVWDEVTPLKKF